MVFMIIMTAWAMYYNVMGFTGLRGVAPNVMLMCISLIIIVFEIWMIIESVIVLKKLIVPIEWLKKRE